MASNAIALLLASLVCSAFGGLQSILILAWLQPVFLLQFLHRTRALQRRALAVFGLLLLTVVVQGIGYTVAFAGMLNLSQSFQFKNVALVLLICTLFWAILILPFVTSLQYRTRFPYASVTQPFVFASIWTALWHVSACLNPIGSTGNPAYTQHSFQSIVLTARFWGLEGIVFLMAWTAALAHESLVVRGYMTSESSSIDFVPSAARKGLNLEEDSLGDGWAQDQVTENFVGRRNYETSRDVDSADPCLWGCNIRKVGANVESSRSLLREHALHVRVWAVVMLLSLAIGGAQELFFSGTFFQKSIKVSLKPTVPVSCILGTSASRVDVLWDNTVERVAAGDALVLWPEAAAGTVDGDAGEAALFSKASQVLSLGLEKRLRISNQLHKHGPYLGITYMKEMASMNQSSPKLYNRFALILPNGSVGFSYSKTHPVYVAGEDISAGPGILKFVDTSIGRISAAICFDFEFPSLVRQAGNLGVDIMLETAETWGSIGKLEFQSDAFRAVENGFTILRCSLYGVSGVVTPFYQVIDYREGLDNSVLTMQLPLSKRTETLYPWLGFIFGWMVDVVALLYLIMSWGPFCFIQKSIMCLPKSLRHFFMGQFVDRIGKYEICCSKTSHTGDCVA